MLKDVILLIVIQVKGFIQVVCRKHYIVKILLEYVEYFLSERIKRYICTYLVSTYNEDNSKVTKKCEEVHK